MARPPLEVPGARLGLPTSNQDAMPRFAANLSTMFTELEIPDRFAAARGAGFKAVEYLMPYDDPVEKVREWLAGAGLEMILLNTRPGDAAAGERGLAAVPGREADFKDIFAQSLEYATGLGAGMIHLMAGVVPPGRDAESEDTFVSNVRQAADAAASHGVRILLEPLNTVDVPGYLHSNVGQTRRLIERIERDNVELQFDFYHLQIMQGNLGASLRENQDIIGHVQFSSLPGRNEPQHGEVNVDFLFDLLDEIGYEGWVGCEYGPKTTTLEGLSWARRFGIGSAE